MREDYSQNFERLVGVFPIRYVNNDIQLLLFQRVKGDKYYPNSWQILYGHCKTGENLLSTVKREIKEEIGVDEYELFTLNETFVVYDVLTDKILNIPLFIAILSDQIEIILNKSDNQNCCWVSRRQAKEKLDWHNAKEMVDLVWKLFGSGFPPECYRLKR